MKFSFNTTAVVVVCVERKEFMNVNFLKENRTYVNTRLNLSSEQKK